MSAESEDLYTEASDRGEATAGHKRRQASHSTDHSADSGDRNLLEHPSSDRTMRSTLYSHLAAHGYAPDTDAHLDDAYENGLEKGLELCADEQGGDAYLNETTARTIHYTMFPALSMGAVWQFLEGNYELAGLMAEGAIVEAGWYGAQRSKRNSDGFTDSEGSSAAGGCSSPAASHPSQREACSTRRNQIFRSIERNQGVPRGTDSAQESCASHLLFAGVPVNGAAVAA